MGKYPITLISNHLSHLDAPGIFQLLYSSGPLGKRIAEEMVFIAGRLAFEPDFTRLGLYMFGTLLVCSKKDMSDNPSLSDLMTKINMRIPSFSETTKRWEDNMYFPRRNKIERWKIDAIRRYSLSLYVAE